MDIATLNNSDSFAGYFEVGAGCSIERGCQRGAFDKDLVHVEIDEVDKVLFFHRMHHFADTGGDINTSGSFKEGAVFVDDNQGLVFDSGLGAFLF